MKILFLTPWYPNEVSINHGIFVQDQAVSLAREHQVIVIASEVDYKRFGLCSFDHNVRKFNGVEEHRIFIRRSIPVYNQLNYFLITLWYVWKIARRFKPDIIHGNISYPGAVWSAIIGYLIDRPFVVTEHFSRFDANFRSWFHRWSATRALAKAKYVIAVSTHTASEIFSATRVKAIVIPNMIRLEKFEVAFQMAKERKRVVQIGFLGVLESEVKGLDLLLKAAKEVDRDFVLHIGGGTTLVPYYQEMASSFGLSDKCKFYGMVRHWEVPEFMTRIDFFVSASRFESFGMVIVEAMASGHPVVATDSGGPRDFVQPFNGLLVPKEDSQALADAITKMIDGIGKFDPLQIRNYVQSNFSEAAFLKKINALYSNNYND